MSLKKGKEEDIGHGSPLNICSFYSMFFHCRVMKKLYLAVYCHVI